MSEAEKEKRKRSTRPEWQEQIAQERMRILLDLAGKESEKNPERAKRHVQLARRIGTRYNIKFPKELKRKFCKKCNIYLVPGRNSTVRACRKRQAMEVHCLSCGHVARFPYAREKGK